MAPSTTEVLLEGARSLPAGLGLKAPSVWQAAPESEAEFSKNLFTQQSCHQEQGFHQACREQPVLSHATAQSDHKPVS
jgi:hypothetical protein